MQPIISGREGDRIKIEVTIDLSGSMLEAEESILRGVNAVGDAATEALKRFDADGDPIAIGDAKWYSKGKLPKTYNTPYGVISVERHVYQRAEGGKTFCPMDDGARIIRKATPRFAKIVSHKFANVSAGGLRRRTAGTPQTRSRCRRFSQCPHGGGDLPGMNPAAIPGLRGPHFSLALSGPLNPTRAVTAPAWRILLDRYAS